MTDSRWQLEADTIELGRARIAEIRAQLAERNPPPRRRPVDEVAASTIPTSVPTGDVEGDAVLWSTDRMSAEMAAGSERDQLRARIEDLESEVAQLRSALAAVLNAAATGLGAQRAEPVPDE